MPYVLSQRHSFAVFRFVYLGRLLESENKKGVMVREKRGRKKGEKGSTHMIWKQRMRVLGVTRFKQGWEWEDGIQGED